MLYLRTGGNGSCKTLFTLLDVRKLQQETNRPVCINVRPDDDPAKPGKPYCNLKAEKIAEFGWSTARFKDWQQQPDGTIFLVDECHYDMPVRKTGAEVPDHIAKLSEHRSRGFDFFLLTQHPQNIDVFVRRLVQSPGWHQHLKRVFGASNLTRVLQWDAVNPQCEKDGSGESAQVTTRAQPKEVYEWYDSAFIHTGKRRIPKQVWIALVCLLLVIACAFATYWFMNRNFERSKERMAGNVASQRGASDGSARGGSVGGAGGDAKPPMTAAEYVASYRPRIPSLMHTAPAYDKLTDPKRVPVPAACVESKSQGCKCYTQDATPYPTPAEFCRQVVKSGIFLAFAPEGAMQAQQRPQAPSTAGAAPSPSVPAVAAPTGPAVFPAPAPVQVATSTQTKPRSGQ